MGMRTSELSSATQMSRALLFQAAHTVPVSAEVSLSANQMRGDADSDSSRHNVLPTAAPQGRPHWSRLAKLCSEDEIRFLVGCCMYARSWV